MNFKNMPELEWSLGYPCSVIADDDDLRYPLLSVPEN
jgi:hypothetical protein